MPITSAALQLIAIFMRLDDFASSASRKYRSITSLDLSILDRCTIQTCKLIKKSVDLRML